MSFPMAADEIGETEWEDAEDEADVLDGEIELPDASRDRSPDSPRDLLSGGLGNDTLFGGADDLEIDPDRFNREAA